MARIIIIFFILRIKEFLVNDREKLLNFTKNILTTITEKYHDKLVGWFGEMYIHCQVSLGSLFYIPKTKNFTDEK